MYVFGWFPSLSAYLWYGKHAYTIPWWCHKCFVWSASQACACKFSLDVCARACLQTCMHTYPHTTNSRSYTRTPGRRHGGSRSRSRSRYIYFSNASSLAHAHAHEIQCRSDAREHGAPSTFMHPHLKRHTNPPKLKYVYTHTGRYCPCYFGALEDSPTRTLHRYRYTSRGAI